TTEFDWETALEAEREAVWGEEAYPVFRERVRPGARVLIMGDNAGEIGLDTLLVKVLSERGAEVTYAVRDKPVLNDATMADAERVGMTRLCRVVSSGSDAPGAVLDRLNPATRKLMGESHVLLSKGQGNFESLEGRVANVFFALKAKCRVVARALDVEQGASVFVHHE
ncbi:MAG: damage-control phosphatase ARMT1 family protein, partial [Oceanidesulfovibrio sp.]